MPTPDITEGLPALLSARTISADAQSSGVLFDVLFSGIGFVFAVDSQTPYVRESSPIQKQQIDTSSEAGEQSLDGAWIRSQTSWHLGAGADFYEPGNRDEAVPTRHRFKDSRGIDPWSLGRLSLLRAMEPVTTDASPTQVVGGRWTGEDVWWSFNDDGFYRHDSTGDHLLSTPAFGSSSYRIVNAGQVILAGGAFGVYTLNPTTGVETALLTQTLGTECQPYWVKDRIITTRANVIHEHALTGGAIDGTSAIFTHPDSDWEWTSVTEAPDAILAAGRSNGVSAVYAFVLTEDTGGSVPMLGQPFQVFELPPGEEILSIRSYLGAFLGIGTTSGIRVGVLGDNGAVQFGPLLVETDEPVTDLGARDSFLYAASGSGVIRVNLAEAIDGNLRFPYANDVEVPDGETITSLAFDGVTDRVVVGVSGVGTYAASDSYVTSGWLESGEVRYGTTAPKAFRTFDVSATTTAADTSVGVSAVVAGTEQTLVTLSGGKSGQGVSLSSLPVPLEQLSYRLILNGGVDTPTVEAIAVKAVPLPRKRRLVQYPVIVADEIRDSKGVPFGRRGYASLSLEALEELESSSTIVLVKDLTRPEQFEATIERIEFSRVEPRSRGNTSGNFGGAARITVSTL